MDGLDAAWSRQVRAVDWDGVLRTWHVLDNLATLDATPAGTLLCVHGNPTWSYMWRLLIAQAKAATPPWRVVAVDHLDMGLSERTGTARGAGHRVLDLDAVTTALDLGRRVVTVGHDWGGIISLGWALDHRDCLAGVVLASTAVHRTGAGVPPLRQFARVLGQRSLATVATPVFARTALALSHPALPREVRDAYLAPYRHRYGRSGIGGFVRDIPLTPQHPCWPTVTRIAENLGALAEVPALLLWGPRDAVFREACLRDLRRRLPHAQVRRFEGAGHLVAEDANFAGAVLTWLAGLDDAARAVAHRTAWPPGTPAARNAQAISGSPARPPRPGIA